MPSIKFLGHSAFLVESESYRFLIDPFISGNPQAKTDPEDLKRIDYIFVTHGHGDHLGDTIPLSRENGATVVANAELCRYLEAKGVKTHPMYFGGGIRLPMGRVKLVPAWHGSGIEEDGKMLYGGTPCGFLFDLNGTKLYHAGDTGLTMEMQLLADEAVDLALLPIGGTYVMDVEEAVKAVGMIRPKCVIPMHYGTFPGLEADPEEFARLAEINAEVIVMRAGESFSF